MPFKIFSCVLVSIGLLLIMGAVYPDTSGAYDEGEIWKLEEKYWRCWVNGDTEAFQSMLHKNFAGWPSSLEAPGHKKAASEFFKNFLEQSRPAAFEMTPAAITIVSNTAIIHCFLLTKDKDGNPLGDPFRVTHTWINEEGAWKLLGGMSSSIQSNQ